MPPLPTILLLCSLAAPVFSATLFVISGTISCTLPKPWQFAMRVVEDDGQWKEDILFTDEVQTPLYDQFFYNVSTSDTHDGGTGYYELEIEILHNCNPGVATKNARSKFILGDYAINHGTHYINFDMNLTNDGLPHKFNLTNWALAR